MENERKKIKLKNKIVELTFQEAMTQFEKLVYKLSFSWKDRYELEDVQQVAWTGLVKAYKSYDISKGYCFMTLSFRVIQNELLMYHRKESKQPDTTSLNMPVILKDGEIELLDLLKDDNNIEDFALLKHSFSLVIKEFNERDRKIINSMIIGIKQKELAEKFNVSQSIISRIYLRFKNRMFESYLKQ